MIDLDYYECKYEKQTNKEYKVQRLEDLHRYCDCRHCRGFISATGSWKRYRKQQYRLTVINKKKERKVPEREHWRDKGSHNNYRNHICQPTPYHRMTSDQIAKRRKDELFNTVFMAKQGQYIARKEWDSNSRHTEIVYYRINAIDNFKLKLDDDIHYSVNDLFEEGFNPTLYNYVTCQRSYWDGESYIHTFKTFEAA